MPCDWDLQFVYSPAAERHKRMDGNCNWDENCNWDKDTEDEPETICNEIFFQQAVRYSDLKDSADVTLHMTLVHH